MKRALMEELPIRESIQQIEDYLATDPNGKNTSDGELDHEIQMLKAGKMLGLYLFHEALCEYGQDLKHEQQLTEILANILIDISDDTRPFYKASRALLDELMDNMDKFIFYTSCDLMTTVYYILRQKLNKTEALAQIKLINKLINVVEFGNDEITEAIELMERNEKYVDLEDTIQYVMARKEKCDYIITNDKSFASGDVPILSSKEALKELK